VIDKEQIETDLLDLPCLVLPPEVVRVMREEGRVPGVHSHHEYLMEYLFGTPALKGRRKKMTHQELIELQRDLYRLERESRNRSFDEESYQPHELQRFAVVAETIRRVFPLVDEAQRKAGRREEQGEGKQNAT